MRYTLTLATVAIALILLAGCGSSSYSSSVSPAAAGSVSSSPAPAAAGASAYGHSAASTTTASAPGTLITTKHSKLGTILAAGPKKLTVYLFEADKGGHSACSGACASGWPPVTTGAAPTTGTGTSAADLGTITRSDGTKQVTYKGHPLYFFVKDKDDGDAYGQGSKAFGAGWYVLTPSGKKVDES